MTERQPVPLKYKLSRLVKSDNKVVDRALTYGVPSIAGFAAGEITRDPAVGAVWMGLGILIIKWISGIEKGFEEVQKTETKM